MTERELTEAVIALARLLGWRIVHFRPALTAKGWRTAGSGDVIGWPDLFAVRGPRAFAAELKSERGRLSSDQSDWLDALRLAGLEVFLWRPVDWTSGTIEKTLRKAERGAGEPEGAK